VMLTVALDYFISAVFELLTFYFISGTKSCNNLTLRGNLDLRGVVLCTLLRVCFNAYLLILCCYVSDITGR
jgi:hypothetical protein